MHAFAQPRGLTAAHARPPHAAAALSRPLLPRRPTPALRPAAPVAAPAPPAAPGRGPVACEALGLKAIGAGIAKLLKLIGIKGGGAAVVQAATDAAAGAAATAGKAAVIQAAINAALKYLWPAIVGLVAIGLVIGAALSYLGLPAAAVQQASTLIGKPSLKLYTNPASRGQIVNWYLKELGVDAEQVNMDLKAKEHKAPEFVEKVNPFGKVPAMTDGGFNLFESGALLLYLADKFPFKSGILTPQQRAAAAQWILFANSTLANSVFVAEFRDKSFPDVFGSLDKLLATREYLEGGKFSVSDVAVGSYLLYVPAFLPQLDLTPYPNVLAYMARLAERPACADTVAARAGQKKAETEAAPAAAAASA